MPIFYWWLGILVPVTSYTSHLCTSSTIRNKQQHTFIQQGAGSNTNIHGSIQTYTILTRPNFLCVILTSGHLTQVSSRFHNTKAQGKGNYNSIHFTCIFIHLTLGKLTIIILQKHKVLLFVFLLLIGKHLYSGQQYNIQEQCLSRQTSETVILLLLSGKQHTIKS